MQHIIIQKLLPVDEWYCHHNRGFKGIRSSRVTKKKTWKSDRKCEFFFFDFEFSFMFYIHILVAISMPLSSIKSSPHSNVHKQKIKYKSARDFQCQFFFNFLLCLMLFCAIRWFLCSFLFFHVPNNFIGPNCVHLRCRDRQLDIRWSQMCVNPFN